MATINLSTNPAGRASGPIFRVSTREISLDLLTVGPDQSAHELGALNETAFRQLLERFAAIPAVKLIDGDPHLVVSAKRGRFLATPSGGAILIRPVGDTTQSSQKFSVDDLPAYLNSTDRDPPPAPPAHQPETLIGAAAAATQSHAPFKPSGPAAPIFGEIPSVRASETAADDVAAPASAPRRSPINRGLLIGGLVTLALTAGVAGWIWFSPPPPLRAPVRPSGDFDLVTSAEQLASLQKRYVGTYATNSDSGERLLDLRADGTYRYQEFGSGVSRTTNRTGSYTFALHRDSENLVIRASSLGSIEVVDERRLLCQRAVFTRVP